MPVDPQQTLYYKRARFSSRLPKSYLYTPAHFWLAEIEPKLWRIGFTRFALRMLGDLVEHAWSVAVGDEVSPGQIIGSVEGFKALSDVYCVASGQFVCGNVELERDSSLLDNDPYDRGWLYCVSGTPEPAAVDVVGYTGFLDATIDKMLTKPDTGEPPCQNPAT
ncbi:MAG TPA: glycine cleavage system protein H [Pirellulales bacterium]|nr:glycine cleavage system protein H [Pirellulales bacterium]